MDFRLNRLIALDAVDGPGGFRKRHYGQWLNLRTQDCDVPDLIEMEALRRGVNVFVGADSK